jgi:hypothetical protein
MQAGSDYRNEKLAITAVRAAGQAPARAAAR